MTSTFLRPTKERKRTYCAIYLFRPITKLMKCGPYKYVKHPMYTSVLLRDISIFLLTTSWLLKLTFLCVFLVVASRIRKEEKIRIQSRMSFWKCPRTKCPFLFRPYIYILQERTKRKGPFVRGHFSKGHSWLLPWGKNINNDANNILYLLKYLLIATYEWVKSIF